MIYEVMNMKIQKEIPVFFTTDDNYVPYLAVAIKSIEANCNKEYRYKIMVIHDGMKTENIEKISALSTKEVQIEFFEMKRKLEMITDRMSNRLRCDYFTLTIYFRLFIPEMFPEYDKGIYIDSDVVVPGDISKMYEIPLGNHLIGACRDSSIQSIPEFLRYMDYGVGVGSEYYINSGVLLMNMKRLRQVKLGEEFLRLLTTYHFDTVAPDQDYLNVMCAGNIVYLDECWDVMPKENEPPVSFPMLIHYNLFSKPWCYDGIQYEEYFWEYAKDSGYLEEIKSYKRDYSDEQKKSDEECLALLLRRADEITAGEGNFYQVFGCGREERLA